MTTRYQTVNMKELKEYCSRIYFPKNALKNKIQKTKMIWKASSLDKFISIKYVLIYSTKSKRKLKKRMYKLSKVCSDSVNMDDPLKGEWEEN